MKKKLAIVGSGVSAMTCAYHLRDRYEITIFEKNDYLGGHTHTHRLSEEGRDFTIDTGFIVFNEQTYGNMLAMFRELGVEKRKSDMSFAVHNRKNGLQYSGSNLGGIFAQRKNILSPSYWLFLRDIKAFFKSALRDADDLRGNKETIEEYCLRIGLSGFFIDNFLAPMSSAVWSVPQRDVRGFPISLLIPFFRNHGLLGASGHYQWYTVKGGSDAYIKKIVASAPFDIRLKEPVISASEDGEGVTIVTEKGEARFDFAVLASHSDESLRIAKDLPVEKRALLGAFGYNPNVAVLHTDVSAMPTVKRAWSSWNHILDESGQKSSTVYWVNLLQDIPVRKDYFISINPFQEIADEKVIKRLSYDHPHFTVENFALQDSLRRINDDGRILFAGAYFGYGFHEDGVKAGLAAAEALKRRSSL